MEKTGQGPRPVVQGGHASLATSGTLNVRFQLSQFLLQKNKMKKIANLAPFVRKGLQG